MTTNDNLNETKDVESKLSPGSTSIGGLIAKITAQISAIIRNEIKFAVLQGKAKIAKIGAGGAICIFAALLSLYLLGTLILATLHAFALIVPLWLAYLIVSGIILLLILILLVIAVFLFKAAGKNNPNPKPGFEKDFAAVKKGIKK